MLLCPVCKTDVEINVMTKHLRKEHGGNPQQRVRCPYDDCHSTFSQLKSYINHGKVNHPATVSDRPSKKVKLPPLDSNNLNALSNT